MAKTNGKDERWLRCLVDKGMFNDEMAVTYPPEGTPLHSVFVPIEEVAGNPGEKGHVRVQVFTRAGSMIAILPTNYRDAVTVAEQDLSDAP